MRPRWRFGRRRRVEAASEATQAAPVTDGDSASEETLAGRPRRGRRITRARDRSTAAALGVRRGVAALIDIVTAIVAVTILLAIGLLLLKANAHNAIVSDVHDAANWLAGPFNKMFHLKNRRHETALNWGVALMVYVIVGRTLARVVRR
jgi:hypothetical protein